MQLTMLKAKLHRVTVTDADLNYQGSITIDPELLQATGILPHEKVEIYNCTNGERFATYVIVGGPGDICVNGAAARLVQRGDMLIIAAFAQVRGRRGGRDITRLWSSWMRTTGSGRSRPAEGCKWRHTRSLEVSRRPRRRGRSDRSEPAKSASYDCDSSSFCARSAHGESGASLIVRSSRIRTSSGCPPSASINSAS